MRVNYFYVKLSNTTANLSDLIYSIYSKYGDYEYIDGKKIVFMERCARRDGAIEIDYTQRTKDGPGYSTKGAITQDFDLPPNAGFGEHTAVIIHGNYAAVQFNHRGVRTGGIARYINHMAGLLAATKIRVEFSPIVRPYTIKELRKNRTSRISFSIYPLRITADLASNNLALGTAAKIQQQTGAEWVKVAFSAGRQRKPQRELGHANEIVDGLMTVADDMLQSLIVDTTDSAGQHKRFNLLREFEHNEIDDSLLRLTPGSRTTYESRISFMRDAFRSWLLSNRNDLAVNL